MKDAKSLPCQANSFVDRIAAGDFRNEIGYCTIVTTDRNGVWRIRTDSYSAERL